MVDFRSVEELHVLKQDVHVGHLQRLPRGCLFRYTDAFLDSSEPPIALHLPKDPAGLVREGLVNLPTYFAGLLPEGIMFNAVKTLIGSAADDLFAVLAATGADAIGDVEVRVPGDTKRSRSITLDAAADYIKALLNHGSRTSEVYVTAIAGVQPKLSLGEIVRASRGSSTIAKFDSPDFPGLIENESVFMQLARKCGVHAAPVVLKSNALVITRFDREYSSEAGRFRKLHVEDMLQVMDLFPNSKYSMEYHELMQAMQKLAVSKVTLLNALRLYAYSYMIGNGDLHAKNVSLIWNEIDRQWILTPAYDLLSTLPYQETLPGADRMALALSNEAFGRFIAQDFVRLGHLVELPEKAVRQMLYRTSDAVRTYLPGFASGFLTPEIVQIIMDRAESLSKSA